jgi:hypothetical protein
MLGKCANPVCPAPFRKLGSGKLFAFESVTSAKSADITSDTTNIKTSRSPVLFWLCGSCSLTFTVGLDAAGQWTLQRFYDAGRVTISDGPLLNRAG